MGGLAEGVIRHLSFRCGGLRLTANPPYGLFCRTAWRRNEQEKRIGMGRPSQSLSGDSQMFKSAAPVGRALAILEGGALSHLDKITVRIANVAAPLAVFL
jgi:hypothetical protein